MSALIAINNINVPFSVVGDDTPTVSSDYVARVFEKRHDNVLKSIENLPDNDFKAENFRSSTYLDAQLKPRPCYALTRDGFSLLVMGFTGERAYQWKIEFIKAFNMMEAELRRQGVIRYVDKISELEAAAKLEAKHHKRELAGKESRITYLKNQLAARGKIYDAEVIERYEQKEENLRAMLHNAKAERDFYFKRTQELKQKQNVKDSEIVRILNKIQIQMDGVYSEIGAVMAYANDNDRFFIKRNQFLKG